MIKAQFSNDGSIFVSENEEFLKKGSKPVLLIESTGHALHAFVNQEYQGYPLTYNKFITLYFINQLSLCDHMRIVDHYEFQHMPLVPLSSLGNCIVLPLQRVQDNMERGECLVNYKHIPRRKMKLKGFLFYFENYIKSVILSLTSVECV